MKGVLSAFVVIGFFSGLAFLTFKVLTQTAPRYNGVCATPIGGVQIQDATVRAYQGALFITSGGRLYVFSAGNCAFISQVSE
jgi:hypothetical protein